MKIICMHAEVFILYVAEKNGLRHGEAGAFVWRSWPHFAK